MSIRTFIEINHDYLGRIEKDREAFVRDLLGALQDNRFVTWESMLRWGCMKRASRHHSEDGEIIISGRKHPLP